MGTLSLFYSTKSSVIVSIPVEDFRASVEFDVATLYLLGSSWSKVCIISIEV